MATSKDIAAALKVTEQTVRQYARYGVIPFDVTPGGHRRFDVDAVLLAVSLHATPREFAPLDFDADEIRLDPNPHTAFASSRAERFSEVAFGTAATGDGVDAEPVGPPFLGVPGTSRFVQPTTSR